MCMQHAKVCVTLSRYFGGQAAKGPSFEASYAAQHSRWRAENRLLLYCSESSGLGAYLMGATTALVASVLSERALILACPDVEPREDSANGFTTRTARAFERTRRRRMRERPSGWGCARH